MDHEFPYSIKRHGTTLEKCEHEPVQTPGCIQSYGVLLALRPGDLTILQISENSQEWLGLAPDELLGKSAALAIGEALAGILRQTLATERVEKSPRYLATLQAGEQKNGRDLHASLHTHAGVALLELENASLADPEPPDHLRVAPDYYGLVRKTLTRFQETSSLKSLSQSITEEVRRITEMDRVMVYRFHPDDSGEVIAESKRNDQPAWLGFRYPAHDIPRPAREIFQKIWSRPVPDIRAGLFEMVPLLNPDTGQPLDMTYCSLRGASIMYTQYLDNMGVRAALTLPLRRGADLWGLVACHHDTPKVMSYRVRAAAEFLARSASQQLLWAEAAEDAEYRLSMEAANYDLVAKLTPAFDFSVFTEGLNHLGCKMNCGGAALCYQEQWHLVGETPNLSEVAELGRWLVTRPASEPGALDPIFQTDSLPEVYPAAKNFAVTASGLLAFCFSRKPLGLILYFRPEAIQTLTWAGNPHELPQVSGPNGPRLSPRKSFELWRETVSQRSMPWKKIEVESVLKLRGLVSGIAERIQMAERLTASLKDVKDLKTALDEHAIVSITGPDGKITFVNDKLCEISKYSRGELLGQDHRLLNSGQHSQAFIRALWTTIAGGSVWRGQIKNRARDGSCFWVETTIVPSLGADGTPCQYVATRTDITARKLAEDATARNAAVSAASLAAIVEFSDDAIIGEDLDGLVTSWNTGAERLFGYMAGEMIGHPITPIIPGGRQTEEAELLDRIKGGGSIRHFETERVRKDGSQVSISVTISPIKDAAGRILGASKVARDNTEPKQAKQALEQSNEALERSNVELGQFAYVASHDLQTPLRNLNGFVQLLKANYAGRLDAKADGWMNRIVESSTQMHTLIQDVLTYSRVDSRARPFEPVSFRDVYQDSVLLLECSIEDAGGEVSCGELPTVMGDRSQLVQLLQNLIGNGLKYHGEKPPCVRVSAELQGSNWLFSVRDHGIGIDAKHLERIFEIFKRLHDQSEYPGTGIGLAVCRRVVQRHGGKIWAESAGEGCGTCFNFTLPAEKIEHP